MTMLPTTLEIIREVLNITANNKKHGQGMRYCQPCSVLSLGCSGCLCLCTLAPQGHFTTALTWLHHNTHMAHHSTSLCSLQATAMHHTVPSLSPGPQAPFNFLHYLGSVLFYLSPPPVPFSAFLLGVRFDAAHFPCMHILC